MLIQGGERAQPKQRFAPRYEDHRFGGKALVEFPHKETSFALSD